LIETPRAPGFVFLRATETPFNMILAALIALHESSGRWAAAGTFMRSA